MDLKKLLNESQYVAATYLDTHLRIIAGAGSGKTRVVTHRIAYLIDTVGVDPRKILAITFTNKAANEMKERIQNLLGPQASGSLVCTIHSLCVRILRQHINILGYPNSFIIMDDEDQKAVLKKIYKELNIDAKTFSVKSVLHMISIYKMSHISPERAIQLAGDFQGEFVKAKIYEKYIEYQENNFMLDFDDLILKTVHIFENHELILEKWQKKFQFIHVDEFQDVGEIEYRLIKMLSKHARICVVGDPDQTIYSFRGANVNYILDFEKDFLPSKTIFLNQNYRSTGNILNISNALIRKNQNRLEKELFTEALEGNQIIHYKAKSENLEAEYVVNKIEELVNNIEGINYNDFLILYRANYLSRTIEQALIQHQIDYRIFGGLKFFSRKEIKDALSYLRLVTYGDDLAFERIINVPIRGVGPKTLERIQLLALEYHMSLFDVITYHSQDIKLTSKARTELQVFVDAISKARNSNKPIHLLFEDLMNDIGYMEMLKNDIETNRIDNIKALQKGMEEFYIKDPSVASIDNYLQEIALFTSTDNLDDGQYVSLMSIHMAKGLEFNYVFVIGLSEGIFPSMRAMSEDGDAGLEEERRLAYVAFTRAKHQLILTESEGYSFVTESPKLGSRFLDEIGQDCVTRVGVSSRFKTSDYLPQTKFTPMESNGISDWKVGDLVTHSVFGKGAVVKINGEYLDIAFSLPHGIRTIMKNHQALQKLLS